MEDRQTPLFRRWLLSIKERQTLSVATSDQYQQQRRVKQTRNQVTPKSNLIIQHNRQCRRSKRSHFNTEPKTSREQADWSVYSSLKTIVNMSRKEIDKQNTYWSIIVHEYINMKTEKTVIILNFVSHVNRWWFENSRTQIRSDPRIFK